MQMEIGKLSLVVCDRNLIWSEWKYGKAVFRNREFLLLESFTGKKVFIHRTFFSFNIKLAHSCGNAEWSWYQSILECLNGIEPQYLTTESRIICWITRTQESKKKFF